MSDPIVIIQVTEQPVEVVQQITTSTGVPLNDTSVRSVGIQGPQGPAGPAGSSELTGTAGDTISAHKLLVLRNGLLYPADPALESDSSKVVGISITAASVGNTVAYVNGGDVTAGSFTQDQRYYAGLAGALSTSPLALGAAWRKSIGIGKSSSVLSVNLAPSILLL